MNGQTKERSAEPWKERDKLPAPKIADLILSSAAVLVSSLSLAFALHEKVSFFALLVLCAFGVLGMRRGKDLLVLLLGALAVSLVVGSLSGASVFLALAIGAASLAFLFTVTARPYAALLPIAVAVGAYFVSGDLLLALLALAILPSGALLAAATLSHQRRTTAICFSVGGFLISLGAILALLLYRACGSLELGAVTAYMEELRVLLTDTLILIRDEFLVYMKEALTLEGAAEAEIESTLKTLGENMSDEVIREVLALFRSILPAIAVVLSSIVSFEAQLLLSHHYFYRGYRAVLTADSTVFTMSIPAAIIYLLSFLFSAFLGASSLFGAAMQNLCLMLLPGFCVVGLGSVLGMLRAAKGGYRIFLAAVSCAALCCAGFSALYFLALWGAYTTVLSALGKHMLEKLNGRHDGTDGE